MDPQPKVIHMKIVTGMLTPPGFISLPLGTEALQEPEQGQKKSRDTKYYVAISGGGWRALASHTGAFRALSNHNVLSIVDTFSSVSGGTWFLIKVSFDENFSTNVLRSEAPIGDVVSKWFTKEYFLAIQNAQRSREKTNAESSEDVVKSFLSTLILQAPEPIPSKFGSGIVAADHFDFSWQELVEQAVLGPGIDSNQHLANATLAAEARANFGNATLAFNWNQLNQWDGADESSGSKWFLRHAEGQQHVQYPVYTSALYREGSDELEVHMQGNHTNELFELCYLENSACEYEYDDRSRSAKFVTQVKETLPSWLGYSAEAVDKLSPPLCDDFEYRDLTVGQVASASSAAVGGGAVQAWVQSVIELARQKAYDSLQGGMNVFYCEHYEMAIKALVGQCNQKIVIEEFDKLLGCQKPDLAKEDAAITAKRWSRFLKKMAIQMNVKNSLGRDHAGHMAIDAVRHTRTPTSTHAQRTHVHKHQRSGYAAMRLRPPVAQPIAHLATSLYRLIMYS